VQRSQRFDDRVRAAVGLDDGVDGDRRQMSARRRILAIKDTEQRATTCVHVGDERMCERRPAVADDQDVI
jgi:hypothetical protein